MAPRRQKPPDPPLLRAGLLPTSLVVFFLLVYVAGSPFGLAVASTIPFVALFLLAPVWAGASLRALDRDLVQLSAAGKKGALSARYARAVGLRLFGPPSHRAERRARIAMELGDARGARALYERAFDGYEDVRHAPVGVRLGHAHACHAAGAYAEAIVAYRDVLEKHGAMPRVQRNLAWSLLEEGAAAREALALLERAEKEAPDDGARSEIALLRAWAHALLGEKKKAKSLLEETEATTEAAQSLRARATAAL